MLKAGIRYTALLSAALLLGLLLGWSRAGSQLDNSAYDLLLRLYPPPAGPSASIILGIDEPTVLTQVITLIDGLRLDQADAQEL